MCLSASLWGCELKYKIYYPTEFWYGQPPCEAVSWNDCINNITSISCVSLLVRLWVEMHGVHSQKRRLTVSLLVRLWVEIHTKSYMEALQFVSLLVRLWVEISVSPKHHFHSMSASLWGCELKCKKVGIKMAEISQPPCEAVSWNNNVRTNHNIFHSQPPCEAVSWNYQLIYMICLIPCQPPCEAVSWNVGIPCKYLGTLRQPPCEAVSWNINVSETLDETKRQPPCEAVSWNNFFGCSHTVYNRQPPCEAVSWNNFFHVLCFSLYVSLLVRLWVEITT